ncbi:creatininase family protein [Thermomicrobiaceae bacterium CFH 74404]|uniref:Creatininase family protein n=1 Tax=Thermalbibacter longus TaxID=2951981 RepID=A0AA41WGD3_9BACT|nr:creatininase family protein [Thermalbibacter longus]MCM8750099.1 creatininase family protein [Thermalbibacter longus]
MTLVQYMTWVDFDRMRQETDLVLIPLGAVEVYGPHLPMGADGIATLALAQRVAERVPAFVAPLIPVGFSQALAEFPGTLSVRPQSLLAYTRDVAESFIRWGCRRILFVNGHAGNVPYLSELAQELESNHPVRCAQVDWWRFIQPLVEDLVESDLLPHGHASEFGTSVMLHLVPEHVRMDRAVRTEPATRDDFPDFLRPRSYQAQTATGVLGDATKGTAEKGAEVMRRAVERVLAFIQSDAFRVPSQPAEAR